MDIRSPWPTRAQTSAPFTVATLLGWALMPVGSAIVWSEYWAATALLALSGVVMWIARRLRGRREVVPEALVFLAALGLLRDAGGGLHSGASVLSIIPVLHVALVSRSRRSLGVIVTAVFAFFLVPWILVGGPDYPAGQYRSALLFALVSGSIGFAIQALVGGFEAQTLTARARGRMLEEVAGTARALLDSPRVREDLCAAARRASGAAVALLYERGAGAPECTAAAGLAAGARLPAARAAGLLGEVLRSGCARYLDSDVPAALGDPAVWRRWGSPESVLLEPLSHGGRVIGVLVVGWGQAVHADTSGRTVAGLIAHEAAGAIARADTLEHLADEAHTDPLTELPNRRAWDAVLARTAVTSPWITLAMIDLDKFKEFNDTHGHPAGDGLLRATAAAWREQLRTGDFIARLGGEEFAILIDGVVPATALEVVERLRAAIPHGCTASAGVAVRRPGEAAHALLGRADAALYEAKSLGRDRVHVSQS